MDKLDILKFLGRKLSFSKAITLSLLAVSCLTQVSTARDLPGVTKEAETIFQAQQQSDNPIPLGALANAKAIGIIKVFEGGISVGSSGGEGVILGRTAKGWSAPFFFHQGGGTLGFQFGVHVKRYIYLFNADETIHVFTGPDDTQFKSLAQYTSDEHHAIEVAYDGLPHEALVIYGAASGLYGGATIGDAFVGSSSEANQKVYGIDDPSQILSGSVPPPLYAQSLVNLLTKSVSVHGAGKDK